MARTRMEAQTPKDEFLLTVVGPLSSAAIGIALVGLARFGESAGWPVAVTGVSDYLGFLNFILAGFNLVPGFPLDGGRLFRSAVWHFTGDLRKATRWASLTGRGFGFVLIGLGVLGLFGGNFIGGIWFIFIGWFLAQAAEASYRQLILRRILEGVRAREAMTVNPETVSPDLNLRDLVDSYFMRRRYNAFPVQEGQGLVGLITLSQVKDVDRERWDRTRVRDVMTALADAATVRPEQSLAEALTRMEEAGVGRVLVVENGHLAGVITGSDISQWLEHYQQLK
jgi:CBS domain-containing protein